MTIYRIRSSKQAEAEDSKAGALPAKAHLDQAQVGIAGYLDVETTGLSPYDHEVIELALALFTFNRQTGEIIEVCDEYVGLREPGRDIPYGATRIHGLTMEHVRGKELDYERIEQMLEQAEFLVTHNASFDRGFVTRLVPKTQSKNWLCSMRGIKWRYMGFASAALQNLLHWHGIKPAQAHRAGADVQCAIELLSRRNAHGDTYFLELLRGVSPGSSTEIG